MGGSVGVFTLTLRPLAQAGEGTMVRWGTAAEIRGIPSPLGEKVRMRGQAARTARSRNRFGAAEPRQRGRSWAKGR